MRGVRSAGCAARGVPTGCGLAHRNTGSREQITNIRNILSPEAACYLLHRNYKLRPKHGSCFFNVLFRLFLLDT